MIGYNISSFAFFAGDNNCKSNEAHFCDTVKRKQKPTKMGQICKNHENRLFQEERPFEENKTIPLLRANCISKDK